MGALYIALLIAAMVFGGSLVVGGYMLGHAAGTRERKLSEQHDYQEPDSGVCQCGHEKSYHRVVNGCNHGNYSHLSRSNLYCPCVHYVSKPVDYDKLING